ncbi:hypothetical protein MSHOH_2530 [Methanosarcina horonobensis HB-1 = JCM 15518]|uniref:Uncharacterized protein n=1 Tax=Methanosarcina horonobensis HB-1 = JCM 15518 TaxID=1434110 RepID=A0A0E3SH48_9EURY|nr:hypothetical protein [Methanosarcina horonobensis]AKB79013.1 hypothetical protein MSHOH_2530 [Methanosarcina horonobensis HB-1 = JCM 15518]
MNVEQYKNKIEVLNIKLQNQEISVEELIINFVDLESDYEFILNINKEISLRFDALLNLLPTSEQIDILLENSNQPKLQKLKNVVKSLEKFDNKIIKDYNKNVRSRVL